LCFSHSAQQVAVSLTPLTLVKESPGQQCPFVTLVVQTPAPESRAASAWKVLVLIIPPAASPYDSAGVPSM